MRVHFGAAQYGKVKGRERWSHTDIPRPPAPGRSGAAREGVPWLGVFLAAPFISGPSSTSASQVTTPPQSKRGTLLGAEWEANVPRAVLQASRPPESLPEAAPHRNTSPPTYGTPSPLELDMGVDRGPGWGG